MLQAAQALFDGKPVETIRSMVPELSDKSPDQLKDKYVRAAVFIWTLPYMDTAVSHATSHPHPCPTPHTPTHQG